VIKSSAQLTKMEVADLCKQENARLGGAYQLAVNLLTRKDHANGTKTSSPWSLNLQLCPAIASPYVTDTRQIPVASWPNMGVSV
jgi:hypothetical protein